MNSVTKLVLAQNLGTSNSGRASGEDMQTKEESEEEKLREACVRGNRFVRDCTSSISRAAAEIARRRREATILRQELYRKASLRKEMGASAVHAAGTVRSNVDGS